MNFPNFILSKKPLHVSGISFACLHEFFTVHSAISCRFDDSFAAGSGWKPILTLLGSCHQTYKKYTIAECTVENS